METLSEFMRELGKYQIRARERAPEYYNSKFSDTQFEVKVLYEMFIDMNNRLDKVEKLFEPAPEEKGDAEADALSQPKKGPKFF